MKEQSQQVRPGLVLVLLGLVLVILIWGTSLRSIGGPGSDRQVTRIEISRIAKELDRQFKTTGNLTNASNDDVTRMLFGTNTVRANRTNLPGQVLDVWGTPYEIMVEPSGVFAIRSAGRNGKFGDGDDITFDSSKHGFLKP